MAKCVLTLVAVCAMAAAQPVVTGRVVDPMGAPLPGARISAEGPESRTGVTDQNGEFSVAVQVGRYRLSIASDGFQEFVRALDVSGDGAALGNIEMKIVPVRGSVMVTE